MELSADARIPFPRPLVFATYRDKTPDLIEYLPNVRRIEVVSRKDDGPITQIVNVWHGGGEIPAAARAFLSEAMLSWTDHARWDAEHFTCEWRIEAHSFTEAVVCSGKNHFYEDGDGTRLEIRGNMNIDGAKLKGVPRLLSGKVAKLAEEVMVGKIRPNLVEVSVGIRKYLEAQAAGGRG